MEGNHIFYFYKYMKYIPLSFLKLSSTSSLVSAKPFKPETFTDCLSKTKSNQPHLLFLPVTVPNSFPRKPNFSPISLLCSVGNGPSPTLVR